MSNDAKLGLLVGVGVVIAIAVTFFRKEAAPNLPWTGRAAAAAVSAPQAVPAAASRSVNRNVRVRPSTQTERQSETASPTSGSHNTHEVKPASRAPQEQQDESNL
jgi:hypothetical protein